MNRKTEIKNFIVTTFLLGDAGQLNDGTSFLENGIIDSTGILELVLFLEQTYGIKVDQAEMLPENFDSIDNIDRFLSRKAAPAAAGHAHAKTAN